jgi:hypothetical protein
MMWAATMTTVSKRPAGPRLRCFLGIALVGGFLTLSSAKLCNAQIVVLKPLHLWHISGYVLNKAGKPLAGVQVALASGRQPSEAVPTDTNGYFNFPDARGEYLLHVRVPGSPSANRQVIVGPSLRSLVHRGQLYIMIKPDEICEDCISPVFTSKKRFDQAVQESR